LTGLSAIAVAVEVELTQRDFVLSGGSSAEKGLHLPSVADQMLGRWMLKIRWTLKIAFGRGRESLVKRIESMMNTDPHLGSLAGRRQALRRTDPVGR
jgi:hypothetical protein